MGTNALHLSGSASSGKIASTGHSGSQAPQSMHSSGSMTRIRFASWMQSTGQTSTQDLSLMSIQGSAMMYVTGATLAKRSARRCQLLDELPCALDERRLRDELVGPGGVSGAQTGGVGVVRVAEDRDIRVGVGDLLGVGPRDVRDHELGRVGVVDGHEPMLREKRLQLAPEEEVDPA